MVNQSSTINPFSVQVSIALIAIQMACFCSLSARLLLISHNFLFASVAFIFFFSYPLPGDSRERMVSYFGWLFDLFELVDEYIRVGFPCTFA